MPIKISAIYTQKNYQVSKTSFYLQFYQKRQCASSHSTPFLYQTYALSTKNNIYSKHTWYILYEWTSGQKLRSITDAILRSCTVEMTIAKALVRSGVIPIRHARFNELRKGIMPVQVICIFNCIDICLQSSRPSQTENMQHPTNFKLYQIFRRRIVHQGSLKGRNVSSCSFRVLSCNISDQINVVLLRTKIFNKCFDCKQVRRFRNSFSHPNYSKVTKIRKFVGCL